jgi:hypothetical protein
MKKILVFIFLLAVFLSTDLPADQRTEPIDVIVALDKSLSMAEEMGAVIRYVNQYIIDELLIPGDYLIVLAFYGKTDVPVAMRINDEADKQKAKKAVAALIANGHFTDIGNALDALGAQLDKLPDPGRKKHLLLITDGIQEAPPTSRYYSRDGKFTHAFLQNTKTIQKKGWKIQILGIGTHARAAELASDLAAQYSEVPENPTPEQFIEKTEGFLASVQVTSGPTLAPFNWLGRGSLSLGLKSVGYSAPVTLQVSEARLSLPGQPDRDILRRPSEITVPPGSPLSASLPLQLGPGLARGEYQGEVRFFFRGENQFAPVVMPVAFQVKSPFAGFWLSWPPYWYWLALAAALVLAAVIVVLIRAARPGRIKSRFRLMVEGGKRWRAGRVTAVVEGTPLFLEEAAGEVRVSPQKTAASLARLTAIRGGVRLTVLRAEKFPRVGILPPNILDRDLRVRLEAKKEQTIRLVRVK